MKKNITKLLLLLMTCVIVCTGCGKKNETGDSTAKNNTTEEKPVALVIIVGRHANAKMYTDQMVKQASEYIERSFVTTHDNSGYTATAQISVIVCDGKPEKVDTIMEGEDILTYTSGNITDLNNQKKNLVNTLTEFLLSDDLMANDPEVDLLSAISKAQNILEGYQDSEHHMLILDTGITTTGALDMTKVKIMETSCDEIVKTVSDSIPKLDGTYVTFAGLGNVAEPQSEITSTQGQDILEELWTSILKYGNAELTAPLHYDDSANSPVMAFNESNPNSYKEVSAVSFYDSKNSGVEANPIVIAHEEKAKEATVTVCLQTADLGGFVGNEATFKDKDKAIATLNTLTDDFSKLLSETEYKLYIVGSIAKVQPGEAGEVRSNEYSQQRADAVAKLLMDDYGIPSDRIITIDAGTTKFSWRNADEYKGGSLTQIDSEAQKNRVVAIISENSSLVEELRNNGYVK